MRKLFSISLLAMACLAAQSQAQVASPSQLGLPDPALDVPLEGEELRAIFQDRTHHGYYEFKRVPEGDYAFTERMNADGTTLHERDGIESAGRWRTQSNVVCFDYDDLSGGCFNMYRQGNCFFAFSAYSREFVAMSVMDDATPDCEPSFA